ncbi:MAG TPA: MlaD family protein [Phycisphaerae bacterium]|nr:MlaD family protein [Phycisphaerae bacterium]
MSEYKRNLMVGVFMLAGLAVLGGLLVLFGETPSWLGGAEYELTISFHEVEGVSQGMPVFLNGLQVGRVGQLAFADARHPGMGVQVTALIKDTYFIPRGSTGRVFANVFGLGRGHIEIIGPDVETQPLDPKSAEILGEMGNPFEGLVPEDLMFSLDKTVQHMGNLFEAARPVADDLHELFRIRRINEVDDPMAEAQKITANLFTVVQRLDRTLKHFNEVLGDPKVKSAIVQAIENVESMTADGRETFASLRETAARVQQDLTQVGTELNSLVGDANTGINEIRAHLIPALETMSKVAENLNSASRDLSEGQGTAGMILRDPRLYEAMLLSVQRITDAVDKLRRLLEKFEQQGYIEFKAHEAVGPFSHQGKKPIPSDGK